MNYGFPAFSLFPEINKIVYIQPGFQDYLYSLRISKWNTDKLFSPYIHAISNVANLWFYGPYPQKIQFLFEKLRFISIIL